MGCRTGLAIVHIAIEAPFIKKVFAFTAKKVTRNTIFWGVFRFFSNYMTLQQKKKPSQRFFCTGVTTFA